MDARLEREPGRGRVFRFGRQPGEVGDVQVDRVDGGLAVGGGRQQHRRPGVPGDVPVPPVGKPAGPAAHGGDEVFSAPQHRDDVRGGDDLGRVEYAERRLAQRHDPPVVAERVELRAGLGLGQHDHPVAGAPQRRDVRRVLGGPRRVDPDDDPRGVKAGGDQRRPGRVLGAGADAVL